MSDKKRDAQFLELNQQGKSLKQIGAEFGITRQAVSLVFKRLGVRVQRSNRKKVSVAKLPCAHRRVSRVDLAKWGCSQEFYDRLRAMHRTWRKTPIGEFNAQRHGAAARGIEWKFTLVEWWSMWEASGKYAERGVLIGQYCMQRPYDKGPYSPSNVGIDIVRENINTRNWCKWIKRAHKSFRIRGDRAEFVKFEPTVVLEQLELENPGDSC